MLQFFSASTNIVKLPPSRPSPTGEGVFQNHFPLGGNRKGGKNNKKKSLNI
jgi:hypothetical protein